MKSFITKGLIFLLATTGLILPNGNAASTSSIEEQSYLDKVLNLLQNKIVEVENSQLTDDDMMETQVQGRGLILPQGLNAAAPSRLTEKQSYLEEILNLMQRETVEAEDYSDDNLEVSEQVAYQNGFDGQLKVECSEKNGEAINRIESVYSVPHRDRRFKFSCVKVAPTRSIDCNWQKDYINGWDAPVVFTCPADYYVSGIQSFHNNGKEDRRWNIKCCRSEGFHTQSCELSNQYINDFRATIDYTAQVSTTCTCAGQGQKALSFFTGFYSYHDNGKEDRQWRIYQCNGAK